MSTHAQEARVRREASGRSRQSRSDPPPGSGKNCTRQDDRALRPAEVSNPLVQGPLLHLYTASPFTPLDETIGGLPARFSRNRAAHLRLRQHPETLHIVAQPPCPVCVFAA